MNKDKTLEELFLRTKPHFDDKADFMESLIRRLDAVEFVRQHQEATIRRYKKAMIAAFVIGIITGAATLAFMTYMPVRFPLFSIHVQSGMLFWISENSHLIVTTFLALLICLSITIIFSNVHDILHMRNRFSYHNTKGAVV